MDLHEVLAPGVEDGGGAQLGLEAFLAELEECGAGALKEQTVKRRRVLEDVHDASASVATRLAAQHTGRAHKCGRYLPRARS